MKALIFDLGMVLIHFRWRDFLTDMGYEGEKKRGTCESNVSESFVDGVRPGHDGGTRTSSRRCSWNRRSTRKISRASGRRRISLISAILLIIRRS